MSTLAARCDNCGAPGLSREDTVCRSCVRQAILARERRIEELEEGRAGALRDVEARDERIAELEAGMLSLLEHFEIGPQKGCDACPLVDTVACGDPSPCAVLSENTEAIG